VAGGASLAPDDRHPKKRIQWYQRALRKAVGVSELIVRRELGRHEREQDHVERHELGMVVGNAENMLVFQISLNIHGERP
jgi:hypothetical protein